MDSASCNVSKEMKERRFHIPITFVPDNNKSGSIIDEQRREQKRERERNFPIIIFLKNSPSIRISSISSSTLLDALSRFIAVQFKKRKEENDEAINSRQKVYSFTCSSFFFSVSSNEQITWRFRTKCEENKLKKRWTHSQT